MRRANGAAKGLVGGILQPNGLNVGVDIALLAIKIEAFPVVSASGLGLHEDATCARARGAASRGFAKSGRWLGEPSTRS